MEFSIVADSGIIEEACKAANHHAACFPVVEISVYQQSLTGFFKFLTVSDIHLLLTASDLNLGLVSSNLLFDCLTGSQSKQGKLSLFYNFLIFLKGIFHCSRIWNYRRSLQGG